LDLCVTADYRPGNTSPAVGILEQIQRTLVLLKRRKKKLGAFRSDSAAYTAEILNYCETEQITFSITADLDSAVRATIAAIPQKDWKPLLDNQNQPTGREYAVTVHCMEKTPQSFTLVVQRWANPQPELFDSSPYGYTAIATNQTQQTGPQMIDFHRQRGQSENYHKEIKNGFGMEYVPCQDFTANAVFFQLGVMAYNLTIAIKRLILGKGWWGKTIATLRWEFLGIAGKVVRHARETLLKIPIPYLHLFQRFRQRLQSV